MDTYAPAPKKPGPAKGTRYAKRQNGPAAVVTLEGHENGGG